MWKIVLWWKTDGVTKFNSFHASIERDAHRWLYANLSTSAFVATKLVT